MYPSGEISCCHGDGGGGGATGEGGEGGSTMVDVGSANVRNADLEISACFCI